MQRRQDVRPREGAQALQERTDTERTDAERTNSECVEYALEAIQEMIAEATGEAHSGTIGIEIPVHRGKLGKVKRLQILFQD